MLKLAKPVQNKTPLQIAEEAARAAALPMEEKILQSFCEHVANGNDQRTFIVEFNRVRHATQDMSVPFLTPDLLRKWIYHDLDDALRKTRTDNFVTAKRFHADNIVDEMISIADAVKTPADAVVASVKIKTRQWVATKYNSKAYGEKVQQEHSLKEGSAPLVEITIMSVPHGEFLKSTKVIEHDPTDAKMGAEQEPLLLGANGLPEKRRRGRKSKEEAGLRFGPPSAPESDPTLEELLLIEQGKDSGVTGNLIKAQENYG